MNKLRNCPVCGSSTEHTKLFLENSIKVQKISDFSFSSRKLPEYMSHRFVQCLECDLVYVDSPPEEAELAKAYHTASFDSANEAEDAAEAYISAIRPTLHQLKNHESALEIGTGTGIFLEYLKREGFTHLVGVEPSLSAIDAAPQHRKEWIKKGIFNEQDFKPESFDLICCFMTLEHVHDPNIITSAALRLLKPGGAFVTITHDYRAVVNRLLGKKSPIIDIEHMQLFSKRSLERLFLENNFANLQINAFKNRYRLQYWLRLFPIPTLCKKMIEHLNGSSFTNIKISINVGNLISSGFKK